MDETLRCPIVNEPALWGLRRKLLDLGARLGLARPAVRLYELVLAAKSGSAKRAREDDGLPLPPARLRVGAGPRHADAEHFLQSGKHHAQLVRELLRERGTSVEELGALLDWGCGCGRILRHWNGLTGTRVAGCDVNLKRVEWCNANLPFAEVTKTEISPPLPYADSTFDLVYAFSVFTHLPELLQHDWMRECRRVLKPGGYLLMSTLGEYYLSLKRLTDEERQTFLNGDVVVLYEGAPGTSLCSAYHPAGYVHDKLGAEFELTAFRPSAEDGRHDMHLFRKPVAGGAAGGKES
jgi:SAM-dependent methyltransferase